MITYERIAPEQYDTLPDIPEPAESRRLWGHREIVERVLAAYRHGRLHHALLLHGPRGIGKATFAFRLAHHVLRHPPGGNAPETFDDVEAGSPLFRQVATGAHPSLLHLTRPPDRDARKFRTAITVDEVRRIANLLTRTAHDGSYRVVIVDPADDMNVNAANALLKNLEEPPKNTLFILVSHRPGALLATIRSRCQAYRFQPLCDEDLVSVLEAVGENPPADEHARRILFRQAAGSPRSAILMTRYGGMDIVTAIEEILADGAFDMAKAHKLADAVSTRSAEVQFAIVNDHLLERVASRARKAAAGGDLARSACLSDLWLETDRAIRQTETYNLDRKQHIVATLMQLREALG